MNLQIADAAAQERAKYAEIWSIPEYKEFSPGLENVQRFMDVIEPKSAETLIDIGCGAGVAGLAFQERGLTVNWLDLTDAGLDPKIDRRRFIETPIWGPWNGYRSRHQWDYGFCCDVMEHIPTEYTMLCVNRILWHCRKVWFQIALVPDEFGKLIGEPLHLTVQPYKWWLVRLASVGKVIDARDLCGTGLYVVTRDA